MSTKLSNEEIYNLLTGRVVMAMNRTLVHNFKAHQLPLNKEQWSILAVLWKQDGCSQQSLAEQTFRDKPSVTRLLDKMEKEDLIERRADKNDRRSNLIFLTAKGQSFEADAVEVVNETVERATRNLSSAQMEQLRETIKLIYSNIETSKI